METLDRIEKTLLSTVKNQPKPVFKANAQPMPKPALHKPMFNLEDDYDVGLQRLNFKA